MPVSGSGLESKMVVGGKMVEYLSEEADSKECRSNNYVQTVKAGSHKEC